MGTASERVNASVKDTSEAQIYEDEAMLKGAQALVGGTVQNLSGANLEGLSLELELKRRKDGASETRTVRVEPQTLAPGERGRYKLTISRDFGSARVLRLRSDARADDISFNSTRGALRPPERLPEGRTKIIITPRPKRSNEEFINTPETADRVP